MTDRSPVQTFALLFGVAFVAVGILGFIPGITTHYGDLSFAGHDSGAKLLGLFQVSILHNIVHILFGLAGFALARTWEGARTFLIGGGVIYLALFLYGIITSNGSSANFIPFNMADDVLHLGLGVSMIGIGFATGRTPVPTTNRGAPA
jgi:Domain of unknown function (DUF4383)